MSGNLPLDKVKFTILVTIGSIKGQIFYRLLYLKCQILFILLKSKFESQSDMIVEPCVIQGKVGAANLLIFESH